MGTISDKSITVEDFEKALIEIAKAIADFEQKLQKNGILPKGDEHKREQLVQEGKALINQINIAADAIRKAVFNAKTLGKKEFPKPMISKFNIMNVKDINVWFVTLKEKVKQKEDLENIVAKISAATSAKATTSKTKVELTKEITELNIKRKETAQEVKKLEETAGGDISVLNTLNQKIMDIDEALRTKRRERYKAAGGDDIDETLLSLIKGTVTTNNDAVKVFVDCANPMQVNSLAVLAIQQNKKELFNWIFDGIDKSFKDANSNSLLTLSADSAEKFDFFKALFEAGADLNNYSQALYKTIESGQDKNFALLKKQIIALNSDVAECYGVDCQGKRSYSGLMKAVMHSSIPMSEFLITTLQQNPQAINYQYEGKTALYLAAERGELEICNLLINAKNISIDLAKDYQGGKATPLEIAAENEHEDVVSLLAPHSDKTRLFVCRLFHAINTNNMSRFNHYIHLISIALMNEKNSEGYTLLHRAAMKKNYTMCELILKQGANVNEVATHHSKKQPPLMSAIEFGHEDICALFLKNGAQANCTDGEHSALIAAVSHDIPSVVIISQLIKVLQDNGQQSHIDFQRKGGTGKELAKEKTALYIAAERGNEEICKILLAAKANYSIGVQDFGKQVTPLAIAIQKGHTPIITLLISAGAKSDEMNLYQVFNAIQKNDTTTFKDILDNKLISDINAKDSEGYTLLHRIAQKPNSDSICKLLLSKPGLEINKSYHYWQSSYYTPLVFTILFGNWPICHLFLDHSAIVADCYDNEGRPPALINEGRSALICAIAANCPRSICEKLVSKLKQVGKEAVINFQYKGKTALYTAAEKGMPEICDVLIKAGADITLGVANQANQVITPLAIAIQNSHSDVVKVLQAAERAVVLSVSSPSLTPMGHK